MRPLVYVILLNWHGWRDTVECLRSLEELDYPNYEILVVDNGSTDDSVARIRQVHPDIRLIETGKNLGFAGGNNVGIRYAIEQEADYVWVLNNDTIVESQALSAMVKVAETGSKTGAVGSVLYHMNEPELLQAWGGGRIDSWWGISRYYKSQVPDEALHYITGASLLVKSAAIQDVGLLDEDFFMYWEDAEFGFRLRKAGWKLAVASEARVWHKEFASAGRKSVPTDIYFNASAVSFFLKHGRMPYVPIIVGVGGRILKRLMRADLVRARAVVRGTLGGSSL